MRTALLLFILSIQAYALFAQVPEFKLSRSIGVYLDSPSSIAVTPEGEVYVTQNARIIKVKSNGQFVKELVFPELHPTHVVVLQNYNLAVFDQYNKVAFISDTSGLIIRKFAVPGTAAQDFNNPVNMVTDHHGNIFIADSGKDVIMKFNMEGDYISSTTLPPVDSEIFIYPEVFSVDNEENIHVLLENKNVIQKFDKNGKLLSELRSPESGNGYFTNPRQIAFNVKGEMLIVDEDIHQIKIFTSEGNFTRYIDLRKGSGGATRISKLHIGWDRNGNLYGMANSHSMDSRITIYSPEGELLSQIGARYTPEGITIDADNNIFMADASSGTIIKFNHLGQKIMSFGADGKRRRFSKLIDIALDLSGHIYTLDSYYNWGDSSVVRKFDPQGVLLSTFTSIQSTTSSSDYTGLDVDDSGNIYVIGLELKKLNSRGRLLTTWNIGGHDVAIDKHRQIFVTDYNGNRIRKFSPEGDLLHQFGPYSPGYSRFADKAGVAVDRNGYVYVAKSGHEKFVYVYNASGKEVMKVPALAHRVAVSANGSKLVTAKYAYEPVHIFNAVNAPLENTISGRVYIESNNNCRVDSIEQGIGGILVKALPGQYFAVTDKFGNYKLQVQKGTYQLELENPSALERRLETTCSPAGVTFIEYDQLAVDKNFANKVTLSPYLSVSVSSDRRRRCFESTTKLTYSNTGYAPAENAKVYLQLPEQVELLSADKPYTRLPNGTYVFDAGTVAAGQKSIITIQDKVVCGDESIRGMTVCTRVWITPGNQSPTAPPAAVISITGTCNPETGKVRFVIRNTGKVDMEESEQFRKYINGLVSTVENYRLAAGDSMVLWVPAGGRTVRLEADQPEGNGDNTMASTTVEACSTVATRTAFSSGFVNILPSDDEEAEVAEECLPIIDSFDPNDKLVLPVGLTDEKYTPTGVALKYKIRFQNTGTDVAYRVVVVDTLSEHLDLSTLQIGSASHAYRYELSGKGKAVLTWTFDNIMLPDSTSNEPGSHGYIQFSIKPKADLREKTAVENYADIFFDYNSPVRTNTIVNRIYDMPPVINESVRMDLEQIIATPGIVTFAPTAGKYGTEVTISGKKFSATAASNKVYINGVLASVVSASETELRVLVPASATTGALRVITPDGGATTADAFEVYQPPVLSGFSPVEGIVGSAVTLQGKHLDPAMLHQVTLGGLSCDIISNTDQGLVVKVPEEALTSPFEIVTKGGETRSTSAYVVWQQPSISNLSKTTDAVGRTINISGKHFAPTAEQNKVLFGQAAAQVIQATPDQLTVKVPQGAASGYITVETPGGIATSSISFEVIPAPAFISMVPSKGSVGTEVEIKGLHFGVLGVQDEIRFNGEKALVLEASDATYKVRVPRGATSGKISITGVGGVTQSIADFVVEALTPAQAIVVYPNPSTGHFTISFLHADFDVQAVQVFDTIGKLLHTVPVANPRPEKLEMDLGNAKAGLYVLQIKTDRGMVTKKLNILY